MARADCSSPDQTMPVQARINPAAVSMLNLRRMTVSSQ
jgi:hypothetical protein